MVRATPYHPRPEGRRAATVPQGITTQGGPEALLRRPIVGLQAQARPYLAACGPPRELPTCKEVGAPPGRRVATLTPATPRHLEDVVNPPLMEE